MVLLTLSLGLLILSSGFLLGVVAGCIADYFDNRKKNKKHAEQILLSSLERNRLTMARVGVNHALHLISNNEIQTAYDALMRTKSLISPEPEPEHTVQKKPDLRVIHGGCPKAE